jgi:hypothetical protein
MQSGNRRGVDYMTRSHPLFRMAASASLRVRRFAYDWFSQRVGGFAGKVILDHGATPDTLSADSNCLIRWFLDDGATVLTTSPEDISHLPALFPGLRVLQWPLQVQSIGVPVDLVVSSSVVQHVGGVGAQLNYIAGLLAYGVPVFLTTPNRGHWLEFHTKLPLLHWLPKDHHRTILRALGMTFWSQERNLNLFVRAELQQLLEQASLQSARPIRTQWFETQFLGTVSNLAVLAFPE